VKRQEGEEFVGNVVATTPGNTELEKEEPTCITHSICKRFFVMKKQ